MRDATKGPTLKPETQCFYAGLGIGSVVASLFWIGVFALYVFYPN